jgi:hypothetical protein
MIGISAARGLAKRGRRGGGTGWGWTGRNGVRRGHVQGRGHRRDALRGGAVALSLGHPRPLKKTHHRDGHGEGDEELEQLEEFWIVNHGEAETEEDMKALILEQGHCTWSPCRSCCRCGRRASPAGALARG